MLSPTIALVCGIIFYGILIAPGRAILGIFRPHLGALEAWSTAPVIGMAFWTLISTYLVYMDIPLATISRLFVAIICILSILWLVRKRFHGQLSSSLSPFFSDYWVILFLVATILALPFFIGGYEFAILRGNGTDAFNYVTMSDALSHFSLKWIQGQSTIVLAENSPTLPLAQSLLATRWSTSALLAMMANALGISSIEFEYVFTLVLMLVLFNALASVMTANRMLSRLTLVLSMAFVVGFWGQFILDIRAFSQIASLPFLVLSVGRVTSPNTSDEVLRYGVFLTSLIIAALIFQYPEVVLAYSPGFALIIFLRLWRQRHCDVVLYIRQRKNYIFSGLLSLLMISPLIGFMFNFASSQAKFALGANIGWDSAYFSWMKQPILGVWGLGINPSLNLNVDIYFHWFAITIAIALTLIFFAWCLYCLKPFCKKLFTADFFLLVLITSGIFGYALLGWRGNLWSVGKLVSFFSILIPIWMAQLLFRSELFFKSKKLKIAYIILTSLWILACFVYAGARIVHSHNGLDFPGYIQSHGEYKRVNAGLFEKKSMVGCPPGSYVRIFDTSIWGREFLIHIVEGRGFIAISTGSVRGGYDANLVSELKSSLPSCIIGGDKYYDVGNLASEGRVKFSSSRNDVIQYASIVSIEGGYGVERNSQADSKFIWAGDSEVRVDIESRGLEKYSVSMGVCPGRVRKIGDEVIVFIYVNKNLYEAKKIQECTDLNVTVAGVKNRFDKIEISSLDPNGQATLIGPDTRDLRLKIEIKAIKAVTNGLEN